MKVLLSVTLVAGLCMMLVGCETTKGAGKDLENTGRNIQDTVDKNN
jgi:predicted small secreted protein